MRLDQLAIQEYAYQTAVGAHSHRPFDVARRQRVERMRDLNVVVFVNDRVLPERHVERPVGVASICDRSSTGRGGR